MADKRWKAAERRFARALGVERIPVTGERHGADFEDGIACYQLKSRRSIPRWLWGWLSGIQGTARTKDKCGVLLLHLPGQERGDALVVLSFKDWQEIVGVTAKEADSVVKLAGQATCSSTPIAPHQDHRG